MKALTLIASAPGKLVIAGEYAVLEGHRALVAAVNRRAVCQLTPAAQSSVSTPERGPCPISFASFDGSTSVSSSSWVQIQNDPSGYFELVRQVLLMGAQDPRLKLKSATLHINSSALHASVPANIQSNTDADDVKLGLGSSAAVACGVVAALMARNPPMQAPDGHAVQSRAHAAHTAFGKAVSGGAGSGIDVAASALGGLVAFRSTSSGVEVTRLKRPLPASLAMVPVFVGHAQSTRTFVAAVRAFKACDEEKYRLKIESIAEAANAMETGMNSERGFGDGFLDAVHAHREAMAQLGVAAGIDVVSAPHVKVAAIAANFAGAAKPSGAGGGDVALCFVPQAHRKALEAELRTEGMTPLDLAIDPLGASVTLSEPD